MTRNTVMKKLLAVAVMALALYGWSLQGQDGSPGTFPHAPHLEDLTCTDCHATAQEQAKPGYPAADFCAECHDNGMPMPPLDDGTKLEADFSHKAHADLECADCHGDLKTGAVKKPGQKECDSCHAENGVDALGCAKCHADPKFEPAYHGGQWERTHGLAAQSYVLPPHGRECETCHTDDSCRSCHQQSKPRSHNGFWRMRSHGFQASMDNESCATCHYESYCIRCHKETKPMNHRGNWKLLHGLAIPGGKNDVGSCGVCHSPAECAACHNQ